MSSIGSPQTIKTVKLSVLTDEDIKELAVVDVTSIKQIENNKTPYPNGTYDPRMGAQFSYPCATCNNYVDNNPGCPGHFGKIKLNWPLVKPLFKK